MTPVLLHLARERGLDERPFLYGAVFMSNAASLFLPGSNLTNLIVLNGDHVSGARFFARFWPAALASVAATAVVLLALFWRALEGAGPPRDEPQRMRGRIGLIAVAVAVLLVLGLARPALPVLGVGLVAVVSARTGRSRIAAAVNVRVLALLFGLAVAFGVLGRSWGWPRHLFAGLDRWQTAGAAAAASVLVNNLPAAVLLAPSPPPHARALLLGLDIGPNLAITGSLSALLWLRVARSLGAAPSARTYSLIGLALVPVSLVVALGATSL